MQYSYIYRLSIVSVRQSLASCRRRLDYQFVSLWNSSLGSHMHGIRHPPAHQYINTLERIGRND